MRPGLDPAWTEEDQDKALAYQREQSKICPNCRTREDLWHGHDRSNPPYIGQLHECPGCEMLKQEQRNVPEGTEHVTAYLVETHLAEPPTEE